MSAPSEATSDRSSVEARPASALGVVGHAFEEGGVVCLDCKVGLEELAQAVVDGEARACRHVHDESGCGNFA